MLTECNFKAAVIEDVMEIAKASLLQSGDTENATTSPHSGANIGDDDSDESVHMFEYHQSYWERTQRNKEMEQEEVAQWVDHIELEELDREKEAETKDKDDTEKPPTTKIHDDHLDDSEDDSEIPEEFRQWIKEMKRGG